MVGMFLDCSVGQYYRVFICIISIKERKNDRDRSIKKGYSGFKRGKG